MDHLRNSTATSAAAQAAATAAAAQVAAAATYNDDAPDELPANSLPRHLHHRHPHHTNNVVEHQAEIQALIEAAGMLHVVFFCMF